MLRYCAWCGQYQGSIQGKGHQIRKNVCEIDTATICPSCLVGVVQDLPEATALRKNADPVPSILV